MLRFAESRGSTVKDSDGVLTAVSGDAEWTVSKKNGALTSWKVGGRERLAAPLEPNFWRATTSNGAGSGFASKRKTWKTAAANRKVTDVKIGDGGVPWAQHRLPTGKGKVLKYAFELR